MENRAWRMELKICFANLVIILRRYALCLVPETSNQRPADTRHLTPETLRCGSRDLEFDNPDNLIRSLLWAISPKNLLSVVSISRLC